MAINISSGVLAAVLGLMSLGLAAAKPTEATNGVQVTPIPMGYRIVCGSPKTGWGEDCDGRTQYCDLTGPVVKCGSCKRICKLDQSTSQCQSSCKMYLEFTRETARQLALDRKLDSIDINGETERKEMKDRLDEIISDNTAIRSMGTSSENEIKDMKGKLDKQYSYIIAFSVCLGLVTLLLIVILPMVIYLSLHLREAMKRNEKPLSHPTDGEKKVAPVESGFNTGETTPVNPAEDDTENQAGNVTDPLLRNATDTLLGNAAETLVGNAAETRAVDETTQNPVAHPSDAPSGEQVSP